MNEITNRILNRLPGYFNNEDKVLRCIVDSLVPELQKLYDNIKIVEDMVSIEKVHNDDIWARFGSMFNIIKYSYEDYSQYKQRVKSVIASKYGGIKSLIKNTVASYINITDSNDIDNYIHVYETATYDGALDPSVSRDPGNFIVVIDSNVLYNIDFVIPTQLKQVINGVKAAGVNAYTTYTFTVLKDDTIIYTSEEDTNHMINKLGDSIILGVFDTNRKDDIKHNNGEDSCILGTHDDLSYYETSITNDKYSLTNSSFITNNLSSYDEIRKVDNQ